jgi:putative membrane protein
MLLSRNIKINILLFYLWRPLSYFFLLSILAYVLHVELGYEEFSIPFNAIATLSTALAIYLGFKNNHANDRWWEGRQIWGLLVNYSRAWAREVQTFILAPDVKDTIEIWQLQKRLIYRQIAFVHALRVFLRSHNDYNAPRDEMIERHNKYADIKDFISHDEYKKFLDKENPPNYLLKIQGDDLKRAYLKGYISDYRFVQLSETLTEFNNHQGKSERIKNTPLPRAYSFFSRIFVLIHGTLLPFAFMSELGWWNIPLSLVINFVFLSLDFIGERTEDPFENRVGDVPLTAISLTIESNLKEMLGETELPNKDQKLEGAVL